MTQAGTTRGSIVLFADDLSSSESEAISKALNGTDFTLSILAFGSQSGAPIPLNDGSLLTDSQGRTVIAKTPHKQMQQLAKSLGGNFATYQTDNSDIEKLVAASSFEGISESSGQTLDIAINHGYWLLPLALLLVLPLFRKGVIFSLIGLMVVSAGYPTPAQASVLDGAFLNKDQRGSPNTKRITLTKPQLCSKTNAGNPLPTIKLVTIKVP
ncbi:TPR domain protein in aerotolerance operon [Vibrio variabilis]|uniref:TPR domain protein in aerotolerance operon n=1 Tax=Vibrio variabilis TaxID=990271 RepID=A0ABQ0JQI5_9VIBR|nr:TPR domain protein in aerotolerance operon [Vibrio variabilis]